VLTKRWEGRHTSEMLPGEMHLIVSKKSIREREAKDQDGQRVLRGTGGLDGSLTPFLRREHQKV